MPTSPARPHLDVWQDAYELVSHLVAENGLEIDHRRHAALDLLAFELLMDGFSRSKVPGSDDLDDVNAPPLVAWASMGMGLPR